jgi:hypothetical protein
LRTAPEPVHLIGTDADRFSLLRAETDSRYRCRPPEIPHS